MFSRVLDVLFPSRVAARDTASTEEARYERERIANERYYSRMNHTARLADSMKEIDNRHLAALAHNARIRPMGKHNPCQGRCLY